ncbi:MAG TPA: molybdopterin cofactor-binding domain-containing protein [Thermoanaerobaculia bacterium]|nr:molybdopterin cofactor-binding domain-containing protein [Thermoanaerobaculia bacterium]
MRAVDRRSFVKLLGGGIIVLVTSKPADLFGQRRPYPEDLNAYLRIDENGHVTIFSGKVEMGQGIHTSLAQMAAEELGVSLDSITMVMGDTDQVPWDAGTWGSLSTRMYGPALRAAAAEARMVLTDLGARKLGVGREKVVAANGAVSVAGNPSRRVPYGELARGKQIARLVDEKAVLRSVKEFKVMGKPTKRLDGREKVTGAAQFAGDVRLPGMLHARILRPPVHGATRKSLDLSKAKEMAGVTVVEQDGLVAVLHADPEMAGRALDRIKAEWDMPKAAFDTESVGEYFLKNAPEPDVRVTRGDLAAGGPRRFERTYRTGYLAHAPVETHTAAAEMKGGKLTVWAGTQSPFGTRARLADALGMEETQVRVITPFIGGGFGGKSASGQALEAARLARITGRPVMVAWTRGEEFFYDTFGPAAVVRIASAIDGDGKITLWDYNVYAAGDRAAEVLYDVPNARVRSYMGRGTPGGRMHPFAVGPWRAPGAGTNVFARESQIDVMAAEAKADPLEFRLRNTSDQRARNVLKAAAGALGWKAAAGPSKLGRGIAVAIDSGTYCALAAEVAVDRSTGQITVKRVVAAQDMGIVVNPEGAKMQMEGCVAMGLGYVLREELSFRGGKILDENLSTYQIPRFSWMPKIETVLVANDDLAPQGGGEPAIVPMGAAIANAFFDLTGVRIYRLPMTPERVKAALA